MVREETPPASETSSLSPLSMTGLGDLNCPPQHPQMYLVRPSPSYHTSRNASIAVKTGCHHFPSPSVLDHGFKVVDVGC